MEHAVTPVVDAERHRRIEAVLAESYAPLQRYLRRRTDAATADDVLGDVLLVLWRRLDDIPADAVLPWCYGVARGCLANHRRADARHDRLVRRLAEDVPAAAPAADPALDEALAALGERDQELLRLWAWEQLPPREIAVVLGVSANAVSIRLHRAVKRLRAQLGVRREPAATGRKEWRRPGHVGDERGEEVRDDA